ncbi:MAG TPA: hypothetical protein VFM16_08585 [Holophagaceae bacterium]|nr:hypothetical protein [Holophagaceae bacterium]
MARTRNRFGWLVWLLGAAALVGMLVMGLVLKVEGARDQARPLSAALLGRLGTEAGAREVYARNPALAVPYPTVEAFLAATRAGLAAFGSLPPRPASPDGFRTEADPQGLHIVAKGTGGGWMALAVERSDGTPAGHAAIGEGVTFLAFAPDDDHLKDLRNRLRRASGERLWAAYLAVLPALRTEEGTRRLLAEHPALAPDPAAKEAFLRAAAAYRPTLLAAAPPETWTAAVEAPDDRVRLYRREFPPFSDRAALGWTPKDGRPLDMEWENGQLAAVRFGD